MLRRVAQFFLWLGLFGVFLFAAAYSIGERPFNILCAAIPAILVGVLVLRRPQTQFEPGRRFRTLRRLGLTGRDESKS
jgi:hypothetical protein